MAEFRKTKIAEIRAQVGDARVICGLSGGVDSAVAAVLIHEAIGDQLTCVFVDHGLMRLGEAEQVVSLFRNHYHIPLVHVDVSTLFLGGLEGVTDPKPSASSSARPSSTCSRPRRQDRRRRFPGAGHALSRRDRERLVHRRAFGDDQEPPQRGRPARAHEHEAGRAAARTVQGRSARAGPRTGPARHLRGPPPVPGPGLAIRIPGEVTASARHPAQGRCDLPRRDPQRGLYDAIWQAFAVLLPVRPWA
jgi:GMP synthase (glutamine-hydrolysing)